MTKYTVATLMLTLGAACAPAEAGPAHERRVAPSKQTATPPVRGKILGGERVDRVVRWPSDDAIDHDVRAQMSAEAVAKLDTLRQPALVSSRPEFAQSTQVMSESRWYATWSQHDGLTVTLNASGQARVYPHVKPFAGNERVRDHEAFVTQNESIWSVTWIEHGVAYDLGLECESPTMPQCQDGAFAMGLAEDLVFVGPKEAVR